MARLRSVCASLGLENVATVIASGNVIFESAGDHDLTTRIETGLEVELGFPVPVFLRTANDTVEIADRRPFGDATGELEISFLRYEPDPARALELTKESTTSDRLAVVGREVYWLHSGPRSESTHSEAKVVRILGMSTTRRSARTVRRIADSYLR